MDGRGTTVRLEALFSTVPGIPAAHLIVQVLVENERRLFHRWTRLDVTVRFEYLTVNVWSHHEHPVPQRIPPVTLIREDG